MSKDDHEDLRTRPRAGLPAPQETLAVYAAIFDETVKLSIAKSGDYGDPSPAKESYFPFGEASYAHMLATKTLRIVNLVKKAQRGEGANFEGLDDSLADLLNYTLFFMAYRRLRK